MTVALLGCPYAVSAAPGSLDRLEACFIVKDSVDGSKDVFVPVSAVERAGISDLSEGQKLSYEIVRDQKFGKSAADNLATAA